MGTTISFTFNGGKGRATIVLDKFFPTNATRLRKLLKMVDEDYRHRDELRAAIVRHCRQRASDLLDGQKDLASKVVEYRTKAAEMQSDIDRLTEQAGRLQEYVKALKHGQSKAYREQLRRLKDKLSAEKQAQRFALASYRDCQRRFVSAENSAGKLKKNAEASELWGK